jgi:hypothetical protein
MDIRVLALLCVLNIPLYPRLGWLLFGGVDAFQAATRRLRPDLGEFREWMYGGNLESMRVDLLLGLFLGACFGLILAEYRALSLWFILG